MLAQILPSVVELACAYKGRHMRKKITAADGFMQTSSRIEIRCRTRKGCICSSQLWPSPSRVNNVTCNKYWDLI